MNIPNHEDPFEKLFDTDDLEDQNQILADTIYPFARFTSSVNPEIGFTGEGESLTIREKLLVFLLASKVLYIKGILPEETVSPSEIEKKTGIQGGSIRPILRKLADDKLVRSTDSGYFVPTSRIKHIQSILQEKMK